MQQPNPLRIAVLMGGPSPEYDISIKSGSRVVDGLDHDRFSVLPALIGRDSSWKLAPEPHDPAAPFDPTTAFARAPSLQAGTAVTILKTRGIQVAFLALHGPFGEDGTLQGLLSACQLRYTGSGVAASAVAMNKIHTKAVLRYHAIPLADDMVVGGVEGPATTEVLDEVVSRLGLPCIVKAPCLGSSFGVVPAHTREELTAAVYECGSDGGAVLVERYLQGRELTCGVLCGPSATEVLVLPVTEIIPRSSEYFDYEAKYTPGATSEVTPAQISDRETATVQGLTLRVFKALGCEGFARVDFISTDDGPSVLEINTIPGLTETSLLPQQAKVVGISFSDMLGRIVDAALLHA